MSPEEVRLVREGWRSIVPIRDTFAELFFGKVFELDPSLRALFRNDLKEQGRNFVAMMSIALRHLDHPEKVLHALRELGQRHVRYGVREQHYEVVATALMLSLGVCACDAFTAEARAAWERAYGLLAGAMQGAPERVA